MISRAMGRVVVIACLLFVLGAIIWPFLAPSLFRILLVMLALGWVVTRLDTAGLPSRTAFDRYSPFDSPPMEEPTPADALAIRELARVLRSSDDPDRARQADIPMGVSRTLRAEMSRRLARRGLRTEDPAHRGEIRALLSAPTLELVLGRTTGSVGAPAVPLSEIGTILDDLEAL